MRKGICFLLIAVLLLSISPVSAYAANDKHFIPPGLAKKGGLPPGIAKKFIDITDAYNWAKEALERMVRKGVISGISENQFAPSRNVTKLEALVMIIRTMEWGDDAENAFDLIKKGKKKDRLKNKIQDWGKGYIDVALEKGLIDEVDLWQQNFTTPATREDVAKYIIRALGWHDKAEKYMDEELRFKDAEAVSIGAVGYIYLIDKEGIMKGYPDHTFRPNQPVKRIEMAQLVANLDKMLEDDEDDEDADDEDESEIFKGKITIVDVDDKEITVKIGNREKLFELTKRTTIKIDGKTAALKDLSRGMQVKITVKGDKVTKISAESIRKEYVGKIVEKTEGTVNKLTLRIDGENKTFTVDKDVVIEIENDQNDDELIIEYKTFRDLEVGSKIRVEIENNVIVKIKNA